MKARLERVLTPRHYSVLAPKGLGHRHGVGVTGNVNAGDEHEQHKSEPRAWIDGSWLGLITRGLPSSILGPAINLCRPPRIERDNADL
jgi:hypothetical protein